MSRIITISDSIEFVPSSYADLSSNASFNSGASGGYTNTSSTNYARLDFSNTTQGYVYYVFDTSRIPSNAILKTIVCKARGYYNRASNVTFQLYSNNTAKGSATSVGTSNTTYTLNIGSWTVNELYGARLRVAGQRAKSNQNGYVYIYGSDLTVSYEYEGIEYEITCSNSSQVVSVSPLSQYVLSGNSGTVTFTNLSNFLTININDNNTNIIDDLVNTAGTEYVYTVDNIGEDHTIVIEDTVPVNLSVTNNSTYVTNTVPSEGNSLTVGQDTYQDIKIYVDDIHKVNIFDNNVKNNNSELTHDYVDTSFNGIPTSYDSQNSVVRTVSNTNNGCKNTEGTGTYSTFYLVTGQDADTWVYYNFDCSSIPVDARIYSIKCKFRGSLYSTNEGYMRDNYGQISIGTTKVGKKVNFSDVNTVYEIVNTIDDYEFSRTDLNNIKICLHSKRGTNSSYYTSTSVYFRFYGAELTIEYGYVSDTYYIHTIQCTEANNIVRLENKPTYNITASSTFSGVTISPTSQSIYQDDDITLTISGITDSSSFILYDNNVNVTSSVTNDYKYTISNVQAAHTLRVEEASYTIISGTSSVTGASFTNLPKKIYVSGSSFIVTMSGLPGQATYYLFDNNVNVTNSISSSQYTISSITADHVLRLEYRPTYSITASSEVSENTISPASSTIYEGNNLTLNLAIPDITAVTVTDNGSNVTSSLSGSGTSYTYTLTNVTASHTITIIEAVTNKLYIKIANSFSQISKVYKKTFGVWVEQSDLLNIFETNKIYINK